MKRTPKKYVFRRLVATLGAIAVLGGGGYLLGKKVVENETKNNNYNNNGIYYQLPVATPTASVQPIVTPEPTQIPNYNVDPGNYYIINNVPVVDAENNILYSNYYYVCANEDIYVKRDPRSDAENVGILKADRTLRYVDNANDSYYRVLLNGQYAYVNGLYSSLLTGSEYINRVGYNAPTQISDVTPEPVVTPQPTPQATQPGYQVNGLYYVVATDNVRIRGGASEKSEIKSELKQGSGLIYLGQFNEDWYVVEYNGEVCYVSTHYSKVMTADEYRASLEQTVTPEVPQELYYVVGTSNVNIRPQPTKDCDVTAELKKNHGLLYLGQYDQYWYIVEYNGTVSYVSTEFSTVMSASQYQALLAQQTEDTPYPIVTPTQEPVVTPVVTQEPVVTPVPENIMVIDDAQGTPYSDPVVTPEQYVNPVYNDGMRTLRDLRDMPYVRATTNVRVRTAADTDSEIYYTLRTGYSLPYIDQLNSDWYVVEYNGRTAFISTQYSEIVQQKAFPYAPQFYCALKYDANIFDDDGDIVCSLPKNELVEVYAQDDGYYMVGSEGRYGFVNSSFCQKLTGTFVVTDITDQTVTLFKDGFPYETYPCITGNVRRGTDTTEGLFEVNGEYRNTVLRGSDGSWESPVDVYLRYYGGQGFHDAEHHNCENGRHGWRDANEFFTGDTYLTNGSHGCTNMLHDDAMDLSENIGVGTKVLVKH